METEINRGVIRGLTYKAGTKESDPSAIGRIVVEFDALEGSAEEIAAMIGLAVTVSISSPQLALLDQKTGELVGSR